MHVNAAGLNIQVPDPGMLGGLNAAVLVVLCALAWPLAAPLTAQQDGAAVRRLPQDISAWVYNTTTCFACCTPCGQPTGEVHQLLGQRYWDVSNLDAAVWADGAAQFKPLLARLKSGQPVHVVFFGSSITQDFGGCFHYDDASLDKLVHHLPLVYARKLCGTPDGWVTMFMQQLNRCVLIDKACFDASTTGTRGQLT